MGHHTRADDGGWAYHSMQGKIDFLGYRARMHDLVTEQVASADAKAIVTAFYGRPIAYAYFVGWSTGGRQAMMEAERYPADFNVIAGPGPLWLQRDAGVVGHLTEQLRRDAAGHPILGSPNYCR